jgi:hypothetical protein
MIFYLYVFRVHVHVYVYVSVLRVFRAYMSYVCLCLCGCMYKHVYVHIIMHLCVCVCVRAFFLWMLCANSRREASSMWHTRMLWHAAIFNPPCGRKVRPYPLLGVWYVWYVCIVCIVCIVWYVWLSLNFGINFCFQALMFGVLWLMVDANLVFIDRVSQRERAKDSTQRVERLGEWHPPDTHT